MDLSKEVELLLLRHENQALVRQVRVGDPPSPRATIPRWHRSLPLASYPQRDDEYCPLETVPLQVDATLGAPSSTET
ncbi:hypothetical protein ACFQ07_00010 [Actinomadura adrarensis]|uniref:Uncharacterized protein n=1 Tax=Actinomadura adrarensis TaxID=1819600 RepID=A0ABW3CAF8_9ACTN